MFAPVNPSVCPDMLTELSVLLLLFEHEDGEALTAQPATFGPLILLNQALQPLSL